MQDNIKQGQGPTSDNLVQRGVRRLFVRPATNEPMLDGIRALAILWVLLGHIVFFHFGTFEDLVLQIFNSPLIRWSTRADFGVDMFFVISGYLIGSILIKELRGSGGVHFRRFYARRFLRLIPVYVVAIVLGGYFLRNVPKEAILMDMPPSGNFENAWANLLYVNNFLSIRDQYMPWCWSLAIEEQFYLIVPFFLLFVIVWSKKPIPWMLGLLGLSGLLRLAIIVWYDFHPPFNDTPDSDNWVLQFDMIYDKPYTRYAGLLLGVLGAFLSLYHGDWLKRVLERTSVSNAVGCLGLIGFLYYACSSLNDAWVLALPKLTQQLMFAYQRDLFSLAVFLLILVCVHGRGWISSGLSRFLGSRFFYPIAQLSYSMYLLHEMFMLWMFPKSSAWLIDGVGLSPMAVLLINGVVVSMATVVGAAVLYVLVERPSMEARNNEWFKRWFVGERTQPEAVQVLAEAGKVLEPTEVRPEVQKTLS